MYFNNALAQSPTIQETRAFVQNIMEFDRYHTIYNDGIIFNVDGTCGANGSKLLFKNVTRVTLGKFSKYDAIYFKGLFEDIDCGASTKINNFKLVIDEVLDPNALKQVLKAFEHICKLNGAVMGNTNLFKD